MVKRALAIVAVATTLAVLPAANAPALATSKTAAWEALTRAIDDAARAMQKATTKGTSSAAPAKSLRSSVKAAQLSGRLTTAQRATLEKANRVLRAIDTIAKAQRIADGGRRTIPTQARAIVSARTDGQLPRALFEDLVSVTNKLAVDAACGFMREALLSSDPSFARALREAVPSKDDLISEVIGALGPWWGWTVVEQAVAWYGWAGDVRKAASKVASNAPGADVIINVNGRLYTPAVYHYIRFCLAISR